LLLERPQRKSRRNLFSIGHSSHTLEKFLSLLNHHRIERLIDTRSQPYSKYSPHFIAEPLHAALEGAGIQYIFMGKELGGRPQNPDFYDSDGHVLYWRLASSPLFKEGIRRVEQEIATQRVVIMCSEEDPLGCHRRLLVGRVLIRRGVDLNHIRGDGRLQPEENLTQNERQNSLFDEPEKAVWRSIQSVLQKGPRQSFSGH
jgi:uncharacterized protein (DUF488 family)